MNSTSPWDLIIGGLLFGTALIFVIALAATCVHLWFTTGRAIDEELTRLGDTTDSASAARPADRLRLVRDERPYDQELEELEALLRGEGGAR